jgi:hypothetical protein
MNAGMATSAFSRTGFTPVGLLFALLLLRR